MTNNVMISTHALVYPMRQLLVRSEDQVKMSEAGQADKLCKTLEKVLQGAVTKVLAQFKKEDSDDDFVETPPPPKRKK